jgi:hypothetical protein
MPARAMIVAALLLGAAPAGGQTFPATPGRDLGSRSGPFDVHELTFDLWCQQAQRYSDERCKARTDADVKAFEDYRQAVEHYELDYLKQQQRDRDLEYQTNRDATSTAKDLQDSAP